MLGAVRTGMVLQRSSQTPRRPNVPCVFYFGGQLRDAGGRRGGGGRERPPHAGKARQELFSSGRSASSTSWPAQVTHSNLRRADSFGASETVTTKTIRGIRKRERSQTPRASLVFSGSSEASSKPVVGVG